ncbi:MAG: MBL fold metallo-hydrolase, partial [Pseudomonadota bacterium]|nr:MBL fold metallo-hydrolase [Pseudomonadota bacterium]
VAGSLRCEARRINIGDVFITGPMPAAFVMNKLVHPESVIVSHANEVAIEGVKLKAGTRTGKVMKAQKAPVYLPLSG